MPELKIAGDKVLKQLLYSSTKKNKKTKQNFKCEKVEALKCTQSEKVKSSFLKHNSTNHFSIKVTESCAISL